MDTIREPVEDDKSPSDDDLLRVMRQDWDDATRAETDNFRESEEDLQFYIGKGQWREQTRADRVKNGKAVFTLNRARPFVRQVTSDIRLNRPGIKIRAMDDETVEIADLFEGLVRAIESASNADLAYIGGAESAARCGMGHWRVNSRYVDDDTFDQELYIEPIANPLSVLWDPYANSPTREDARFCFVTSLLSKQGFKAAFPDATATDWDSMAKTSTLSAWVVNDSIRVVEYFVKKPKIRTIALLGDDTVLDITDLDTEKRAITHATAGIKKTRKARSHVVCWYKASGTEILEGPIELGTKYIPIVSCFGEETHMGDGKHRASVIRDYKDAQVLYNFWRSEMAEMAILQSDAPYLIPDAQLAGYETVWNDMTTARRYLPYKLVAGVPAPQRQAPPMMSAAASEEARAAADDMMATIGIFDASLGKRSNETSGVAIERRQQEGDTSTFGFIDNTRVAIRHTGTILVDWGRKTYDTARILRILNEDGTEKHKAVNQVVIAEGKAQVMNDLSKGKFDIQADTGPGYTTRRQEAAAGFIELIKALPTAAPIIADLAVQNQDWPGAARAAKRLKKTIPPNLLDPEEDSEELQAIQQQGPPPPSPEQQAAEAEAAQRQQDADLQTTLSADKVKMAELSREVEMARIRLETDKLGNERDNMAAEHNRQATEVNGIQGLLPELQNLADAIGSRFDGIEAKLAKLNGAAPQGQGA